MKVMAFLVAAASVCTSMPARAGTTLALACLGCHEPSVDSPEMPALNLQSSSEIAEALRRFRDRPAPGSIMARFTARLTDEEIESLARELGKAGSP